MIQPPGNRYDEMTVRVHHITPEMTADAPTFDKVWEEIGGYILGNWVVAHNASFDYDVLMRNLDYYGIEHPYIYPFACTCEMYEHHSLEDMCEAFHMPFGAHHDALFDAECCAEFFLHFLNKDNPDWSAVTPKGKKADFFSSLSGKKLSSDLLEKDLTGADPANPFFDRKVVITGEFQMERKDIANRLKSMGADINTAISKCTDIVLIGSAPGPSKIQKLNGLIEKGCPIRKLNEDDLNRIFAGNWDDYK